MLAGADGLPAGSEPFCDDVAKPWVRSPSDVSANAPRRLSTSARRRWSRFWHEGQLATCSSTVPASLLTSGSSSWSSGQGSSGIGQFLLIIRTFLSHLGQH